MYDVAVVGGGFWGKAIAMMAEQQGLSVALVDKRKPEAASVVAAGLFCPRWFKGEWRTHIERAVEDSKSCGVRLRRCQGMMSTIALRKSLKGMVAVDDWYTFGPKDFLGLRPPDYVGGVARVREGAVEIEIDPSGEGGEINARRVVVAAGVNTDSILRSSGIPPIGVKGLRGSALLYEGSMPDMLLMHQVTPYYQYTLRPWTEGARLGDTLERVPSKGDEYVEKMHVTMAGYLGSFGLLLREKVTGVRPVMKEPTVSEVAKGVIAATGGGRVGALLSFWAARKVIGLL